MGNEAERMFRETYTLGFDDYGLRLPPIQVSELSLRARTSPDFVTSHGFVEAMGVGRDRILKLKVEKYIGMRMWHSDDPVRLFVWDSHKRRHVILAMSQVTDAVMACDSLEKFPEGKAYYPINVDQLAVEWTQVADA